MKKRIYKILAISTKPGDLSWWYDVFLFTLIGLNVVAIVLESIASVRTAYKTTFAVFELVSIIIFSIEYILRLWTANESPRYSKPVWGNIRYAFTTMAIIDLLAILPFYLPLLGVDMRVIRIMWLFRLLRLFKIARYIKALLLFKNVIREKREELLMAIIFTVFMLLISSTLMYYIEHNAQPDTFASIPKTMWWSIATLTTVGYGDVYPITALGKVLGGVIAILGIGLFALPTGILASGFSEQLSKENATEDHHVENEKIAACPHCGEPIEMHMELDFPGNRKD